MPPALKYTDLVDIPKLQTLLDSWHAVLGIANAVIDLDGHVLAHAGWQEACTRFHRQHPDSCRRCIESDTSLACSMTEGKHFAIYSCHNGLIDTAAPIVIDGQHLANVFTGQFLSGPADLAFFRQQAHKMGYDTNSYLAAINKLPVIPPEHARKLTELYAQLATMLGDNGLDRLRQQESTHELAKLNQQLELIVSARTEALVAREALLAQILDTSSVSIFRVDHQGFIINANRRMAEMFGIAGDSLVGKHYTELIAKGDEACAHRNLSDLLNGARMEIDIERRYLRSDGSVFWGQLTGKPFQEADGRVSGLVGVIADINARKLAEERIRHLAYFDSLTSLPNRQYLLEKLELVLQGTRAKQGFGALFFIDLDNFKTINDTRGHDQGDQLLQQVAARLRHALPSSCVIARLGGDEFVVLSENLSHSQDEAREQAGRFGQQMLAALRQPFRLAGEALHNTASIGIALFQPGHEARDELLKQADLAMYQAKAAGRNNLCFFNPALQASMAQRALLELDMYRALQAGEFCLFFQPQHNQHGQLLGSEAMVRWLHPQMGQINPIEFIAQAEENGQILPLGDWILRAACQQLADWQGDDALATLPLSVNVSARQFQQAGFVSLLTQILANTGAKPHLLKLELTESLLLQDLDDICHKMQQLRQLGISFALDDFGTGYSSLSYLRRLPLDQLKIDRSFVRDIQHSQGEMAIIRMIVALAESLGLEIVAEGVENEAQRAALASCGCLAYQGYLYCQPLPAEAFAHYVRECRAGKQLAANPAKK